ncbi:MAG: M56/M15 family metallopeptidase [Ferruginibacter sp.]
MFPFAYYLMKVIACSAILFAYYWFFLRNKIFHSYNRFYLLAVVILSLTAPVMKFNFWQNSDAPKTSVIKMLQVVSNSDEYMDEVIIDSSYKHLDKAGMAMLIFVLVSIVMTFIFIRSLLKIYSLKRKSPRLEYGNVCLIYTDDKSSPFSFLRNIFWNNNIDINSKNGKRILKHELAHVQEKHSQDKLFVNLVLIFFWCNPIFWFLRKEINLLHEFLADKKAVEDGDTTAFAAMILQTVYPSRNFEFTNNFFYSPIKRRLTMLSKNNKARVNYISRLLALPLVFLIIAAFTFKTKAKLAEFVSPASKTFTVVIDAGHGGKDNGAVNDAGTYEKSIALTLAKKILAMNTNANIKILLTRETDIYQSPQEKAAFAKQAGADLFISVHMGSTDLKNANQMTGLAVYVAKDQYANSKQSKLFASALVTLFQNNFDLDVLPNPQQRQVGIWILQANDFPSVLIEAGFMSNKKDIEYLQTDKGEEAFARNVLIAIENYRLNKDVALAKEVEPTLNNIMNGTPEKDAIYNDLHLLVINGKVMGKIKDYKNQLNEQLKVINTDVDVKFLQPKEAVAKYGTAGKYGASEVTYNNKNVVRNKIQL